MIVNNRNFACLARVHYTALSLGLQISTATTVIRWVTPKFRGRPTFWSVDHHKIVSTECACSLGQTCCMRTTCVWKCFVYSRVWWFPGKWACKPTPNHVVVLKRTKRWWDRHGHFKSSNTCKPLLIVWEPTSQIGHEWTNTAEMWNNVEHGRRTRKFANTWFHNHINGSPFSSNNPTIAAHFMVSTLATQHGCNLSDASR